MSNPIMSMLRTPSEISSSQTPELNLPKVDKNMSFAQFAKLMKGRNVKGIVDQLCASGRMTTKQRDDLYNHAAKNIKSFSDFLK